jgi:hypothetical protein
MALALLAGRPLVSKRRKDGRSQRLSLANNLPANAADVVKAVHGAHNGRGWARRQGFLLRRRHRRNAAATVKKGQMLRKCGGES